MATQTSQEHIANLIVKAYGTSACDAAKLSDRIFRAIFTQLYRTGVLNLTYDYLIRCVTDKELQATRQAIQALVSPGNRIVEIATTLVAFEVLDT